MQYKGSRYLLVSAMSRYGGFQQCCCIVTASAQATIGSKNGFVGLLRENGIGNGGSLWEIC